MKKRLILYIVFCATIISGGITDPVFALNNKYDETFYSNNDILFYNPEDSSICSTNSSSVALVGNDNPEKVWNFLTGKGLSDEQTAGVMGNIQAESGFNPSIEERSNSVGFGIVQWSYGRRSTLEAAATAAGKDVSDLAFQLEYLYAELNSRPMDNKNYTGMGYTSEWNGLTKQTTIEDALVLFHHEFEISHLMDTANPRASVIEQRGQFAQNWFNQFGGSDNSCGSGAVHPIADGARVNEGYGGPRNVGSMRCKGMIWHNGYDLNGSENTTAVYAAMSGVVSGPSGYNNMVAIQNEDGFIIQYLHMNNGQILVKDGDKVKSGQKIGTVGNTGYSTGAHLHFQIEVSGNTNPRVADLPVVPCGGNFVNPSEFMKLFGVELCPTDTGCDNPKTS